MEQLMYLIKMMIVALVVGGFSAIMFNLTNKFFSKYDDNKIVITHNLLIIYTILMIGLNLALLTKYRFTVSYLFLAFLLLYLSICAFIDYEIQMVYTILSVIAGVGGLVFFSYTMYTFQTWKHLSLLDILVFAVIMGVAKAKEMFGDGDWDVFMVIAIYICALPSETFPMAKVLLIMSLAEIVQFIANLKKFDFKRWRLKEEVAFVPAIFLSVAFSLFI